MLPRDLPRLDLAASLPPGSSRTCSRCRSAWPRSGARPGTSRSTRAILDRVIGVLDGSGPAVAGAPASRPRCGRSRRSATRAPTWRRACSPSARRGRLGALYGQGATDRVVLERALGIEAQLRKLAERRHRPGRPAARPAAGDRGRPAGQPACRPRLLGSFVVTALTHLVGRVPAAGRAGLVAAHAVPARRRAAPRRRARPAHRRLRDRPAPAWCSPTGRCRRTVRQRIGRGNAAVAFMRLGNAEEAKAASEQIGAEHRFVALPADRDRRHLGHRHARRRPTPARSATPPRPPSSTIDSESRRTAPAARSPAGAGRPAVRRRPVPLRARRARRTGTTESASLTAGISTSTAWGVSTSRATGDSESLARSLQRSRELVVEPSELQRLPATAMIVSYGAARRPPGPAGRRQPGHRRPRGLHAERPERDQRAGRGGRGQPGQRRRRWPAATPENALSPNLGPPPTRPDWRRGARS